MRVVINQKHLVLNDRLATESNCIAGNFSNEDYSKIEDVDCILLKRDITIRRKKEVLIKKLHSSVVGAFSINRKGFNKKSMESLKKKVHNLRKIVLKLRSLNYYLETIFLEELGISKIKIRMSGQKLRRSDSLAGSELGALEYAAYRLIERAAMLDKKLLGEYAVRGKKVLGKEMTGINDIGWILRKESLLLEHMEAKLPPPKHISADLVKEPVFTHWVARVFALLSYLEHTYAKEAAIFRKLNKNRVAKMVIGKKIAHLIKERSELLRIMEEKALSMKKYGMGAGIKKEVHNLTAAINL